MIYKKIKWYNKILCFFIGHKKLNIDQKKAKPGQILITTAYEHMSFSLNNGEYISQLNLKACKRCGIYQEVSITQNSAFLTSDEKIIKDIIE